MTITPNGTTRPVRPNNPAPKSPPRPKRRPAGDPDDSDSRTLRLDSGWLHLTAIRTHLLSSTVDALMKECGLVNQPADFLIEQAVREFLDRRRAA